MYVSVEPTTAALTPLEDYAKQVQMDEDIVRYEQSSAPYVLLVKYNGFFGEHVPCMICICRDTHMHAYLWVSLQEICPSKEAQCATRTWPVLEILRPCGLKGTICIKWCIYSIVRSVFYHSCSRKRCGSFNWMNGDSKDSSKRAIVPKGPLRTIVCEKRTMLLVTQ